MSANENLAGLSAAGVSVWIDDISRDRLETGNLQDLINESSVVGVTSNPTIFATAISKGSGYDEQIADLAVRKVSVEEAARAITTYDIRWAADVLAPVFQSTGGQDGRVSIEVDPRLAHETEATVAEAKALWWMVDRPNTLIKIPATPAGLPAITAAVAAGISVNVTLIFSLQRYREVMDAYMAGLESAKAAGIDLSTIHSVASFFVSRVDAEIDKRLDAVGSDEAKALKGKAAVANARLAYKAFEDVVASERWQALADAGAHPQRPLWASTSVKNPEYRDVLYVEELIVPGTVNTMPEGTIHDYGDHGVTEADTVRPFYDDAAEVMRRLEQVGVDYDDVVQVLEDEGVEKFIVSWNQLLEQIESKLSMSGDQK
ncbi:transaldolase [Glycomyces sp. TRM65418]|uniref:transaldolase n=1 Tax=Glycomyces sp. TRM65418 TaxID=2867006 RepID=UPI001CE5C448|nr:transaldolase [Glycomyces sp. TRM65418]MCC3764329.1 transaldolase [Glycomyces sp. TRM65418]QZD54008.1 transaldolase [Glycomyces sp. TRM65418]